MSQAFDIDNAIKKQIDDLDNTWQDLPAEIVADNQVKKKTLKKVKETIRGMYPNDFAESRN